MLAMRRVMVLSEDGTGWGKASPDHPESETAAHSQRRPPAGARELIGALQARVMGLAAASWWAPSVAGEGRPGLCPRPAFRAHEMDRLLARASQGTGD
jgi:hypothetical protein